MWPDIARSAVQATSFTGAPQVGSSVELVGMKQKNGSRGILVKECADGKWKVSLDSGKGFALLRPEYFKLVDVQAEAAALAAAEAAAKEAAAAAAALKEDEQANKVEQARQEHIARQREAEQRKQEAAQAALEKAKTEEQSEHRSRFRDMQREVAESRSCRLAR